MDARAPAGVVKDESQEHVVIKHEPKEHEVIKHEHHDHDDAVSVQSDLSTTEFHTSFEEEMLNALEDIKTPGSFASFGTLSPFDPAITVEGVGQINLPLGEEQARQLIELSRQAPFGKGSETIVDTSVRNTWEIDAEKLTFANPRWEWILYQVCRRVASDLGISSPIQADLYKMLLYEKGAMFKAHTE